MNELILRLCGVPVDQAANVTGAELTLRYGGALGWVIVLALALGVLTWRSYRRDTPEMISPGRRRVLTALRILLFCLLLLLMLRPVLAFTIDAELWSSPCYFLFLTLVASTEWALRKRWQLK